MPIHIRNLSKSFDREPLYSDFSIDLPESGCVCFFGPSGIGKTTLFNMLAGILPPDSGEIRFSDGPQKISFVFQEDRLLPWISAAENIEQVLEGKNARMQALEWLDCVGLSQSANKLPGNLSGGMRQRVSIARALAFGGDILLLDEPFQGIDARNKETVFALLSKEKTRSLIVLVTHYAQEALRLADTIHVLMGPPVAIENTLTLSEAQRDDPAFCALILRRMGVTTGSPSPAGSESQTAPIR